MAVHIYEATLKLVILVGQRFVIKPHEVQDGRLEILNAFNLLFPLSGCDYFTLSTQVATRLANRSVTESLFGSLHDPCKIESG